MHARTSHVISTKDIIYPRLRGRNASGWYLTHLAYDGGLAGRLTSNLERCSGETIPLRLIHQGSAVDTTLILAILIITTKMSYIGSCMKCQAHIILNMEGISSCPGMSIVLLVHSHHEFGIETFRGTTNKRKLKN
jgi:hypothetical protein